MGRTERKRSRRKVQERALNVENELPIINLKKWLVHNSWFNNTDLKLRKFPLTGRGVTSSRQVEENDILITVPYDLMITYNTVLRNLKGMISPLTQRLKMHDLLALFLMVERGKQNSLWKEYLDSLPSQIPLLPWHAPPEEIDSYPADLQIICKKNRLAFVEAASRLQKSINDPDGCVLDENLFKWGYVLVNTRAVYVDPVLAARDLGIILIDQPSMALCPFLDMFNHHFSATTEAKVVVKEGKKFYQLKTLTKYRKYDQIFISYGAHDNIKLLVEYGFFIPGNTLDVVRFDLEAVLNILNIKIDHRRYKFILNHNFNEELYVGCNTISFNLKAVLFVFFSESYQDYNSVIFGDTYPDIFLQCVDGWILDLLDYKVKVFADDYKKFRLVSKSEHGKIVEDFLKYRTDFATDLINRRNLR